MFQPRHKSNVPEDIAPLSKVPQCLQGHCLKRTWWNAMIFCESAAVGSDRNGDQYSLLAQRAPQLETNARQISLREFKCSALR